MKINDFLKLLENYAPLQYSKIFCEKYGAYDNSGIIVDTKADITGVVFTLDLTKKAVDLAIEKGANLIVTHHPAIYKPISEISDFSNALLYATSNKIAIISMHLNLDSAEEGIDYYFAKNIGAKDFDIIYAILDGGYGRTFTLKNITLYEIAENIKNNFKTQRVLVYGKNLKKDYKVASFCGAGLSQDELKKISGVDLVISADIKHDVLVACDNLGISVITLTHYASEFYGFTQFYNQIKKQTKMQVYLNNDEHLL